MPWQQLNPREIETYISGKKKNEAYLLEQLEGLFNINPLRGIIQGLSHHAIADLIKYADKRDLASFLQGEKMKEQFWHKPSIERRTRNMSERRSDTWTDPRKRGEQFKKILKEGRSMFFDAADCADIMLMYGTFVEETESKYLRSKGNYSKKKKDSPLFTMEEWRAGRRKPREPRDWEIETKDHEGEFRQWEEQTLQKRQEFEHQQAEKEKRKPKQIKKQASQFIAFRRDDDAVVHFDSPFHPRSRGKRRDSVERDKRRKSITDHGYRLDRYKEGKEEKEVTPGTVFWKLSPESTINQINRMFGLGEGADISGTTADTIFAIEALWTNLFSAKKKMGEKSYAVVGAKDPVKFDDMMHDSLEIRPLVCLLPLVTMSSRAHHTILECAFALSINGYLDYSIGYYTTLKPRHWSDDRPLDFRSGMKERFEWTVSEFNKILTDRENDDRNRMMLINYESRDSNPHSIWLIDKGNGIQYQRFCAAANLKDNGNIDSWVRYLYQTTLEKRYPSLELCNKVLEMYHLKDAPEEPVDAPRIPEDEVFRSIIQIEPTELKEDK